MINQASKLQKFFAAASNSFENKNKIFAFTSGKGGTGKTFVSVNLADTLAKLGKRILLVDFDSNLSNAEIIMNVTARNNILDFFLGKNQLPDVITKVEHNLDIIVGESGKINFPQITYGMIDTFFACLKKIEDNYDYILIDTGAGINEAVLYLTSKSDINLIVVSPEPTAIMDSYAVIKLLELKNRHIQNYVLVNKCDSRTQAKEAFDNLNTAVNHFLNKNLNSIGYIDYDASVRKSIINQEIYVQSNPSSIITCQFKDIASNLLGIQQMANIRQKS